MLNPSLNNERPQNAARRCFLWGANCAETSSLQQTETIDRNGLINVCVLHLFISASNINGNKRICFPNEHEAIRYFRHTSLRIQSRKRPCIFKGPRFNNRELPSWQRPGSVVLKTDCCTTSRSLWIFPVGTVRLHPSLLKKKTWFFFIQKYFENLFKNLLSSGHLTVVYRCRLYADEKREDYPERNFGPNLKNVLFLCLCCSLMMQGREKQSILDFPSNIRHSDRHQHPF